MLFIGGEWIQAIPRAAGLSGMPSRLDKFKVNYKVGELRLIEEIALLVTI